MAGHYMKRELHVACHTQFICRSMSPLRMTKGDKYVNLIFDLVIPVDCKWEDDAAAKAVAGEIKARNPDCFAVIKPEHPFV